MCAGIKRKAKFVSIHSLRETLTFNICEALPGVTQLASSVGTAKRHMSNKIFMNKERFIGLLYSEKSKQTSVDVLCVELFHHTSTKALPLTQIP